MMFQTSLFMSKSFQNSNGSRKNKMSSSHLKDILLYILLTSIMAILSSMPSIAVCGEGGGKSGVGGCV